jgi:plasmid replication initiation protein
MTLQFHDRLKPLLLNLREIYTKVPIKTVFKLQGGYAIRWYEKIRAEKYIGSFTMTEEELRQWLQVPAGHS